MPYRIEVGLKPGLFDARGQRTKRQILHAFENLPKDTQITCTDIYTIDSEKLDDECITEAFCDPVIQNVAVNKPLSTYFDWYIEVGFKPGVTDNVGHSAQYALKLITGSNIPVYSARAYLLKGSLSRETATEIAQECLANSLIQ
ncbi:MAG: phosphoribosylformylglycinamidine synthase, partial [Deltaproteobacteria bacterium]|nr:phosphoribosylformylglycinamidine synthase [Deltaproteobacteria bacterium]